MLIVCSECEGMVSDKAIACPHCGLPMKGEQKARPRASKRMRLPNGFGQIYEIKSKPLRNPYRATVTTGKTGEGKYVSRILGYYSSYNDAYLALVEFHKNPYDLDSNITVRELYEKWSERAYKERAANTTRTLESAWQFCSSVYDMPIREVRSKHIIACIEESNIVARGGAYKGQKISPSAITKTRIKLIWDNLFDYAIQYELVDKNYASVVKLSQATSKKASETIKGHKAFTEAEISLLWQKSKTDRMAKIILLQCYSGWRPAEMLDLRVSNINLADRTMIGGGKTKAGKNRTVPIHESIFEIVEYFYNDAIKNGREYLLGSLGKPYPYGTYRDNFKKCVADHSPHDGRKTFVTMAKRAGVDEFAIKRIVGHSIMDVTEAVYTERNFSWLASEMAKIQVSK